MGQEGLLLAESLQTQVELTPRKVLCLERKAESGALGVGRYKTDLAAELLDEQPRDYEAEPDPLGVDLLLFVLNGAKYLEEFSLVFRLDSDAVVGNFYL